MRTVLVQTQTNYYERFGLFCYRRSTSRLRPPPTHRGLYLKRDNNGKSYSSIIHWNFMAQNYKNNMPRTEYSSVIHHELCFVHYHLHCPPFLVRGNQAIPFHSQDSSFHFCSFWISDENDTDDEDVVDEC